MKTALQLYLALAMLLALSQCTSAHADTKIPPHTYVYELVLEMPRSEKVHTGTAYRTQAACESDAAQVNGRANSSAVKFKCESIVLLKE